MRATEASSTSYYWRAIEASSTSFRGWKYLKYSHIMGNVGEGEVVVWGECEGGGEGGEGEGGGEGYID